MGGSLVVGSILNRIARLSNLGLCSPLLYMLLRFRLLEGLGVEWRSTCWARGEWNI